jgi:nitroreductase
MDDTHSHQPRMLQTASTGNFWAPADSAIAVTHFELVPLAHGLGTCWPGLLTQAATTYAPIAEFLGPGQGQKINGAVMFDYQKYRYKRISMRNRVTVT